MNRSKQPFMMLYFLLVPAVCGTLLLAGCGQTGPLYLPDKTEQAEAAGNQPISEEAAEDAIEPDEETG